MAARLQTIRTATEEEVPEAKEAISYQMPAFTLGGRNLIFFAAYENHIGLNPASSAMEASIQELSPYRTGKGTLQFPLDQPLPLAIVREVVRFRVREDRARKDGGEQGR